MSTITGISPNRSALERGRAALDRGDRARALSCFEQAVLDQPKNALARLLLGNILRDLGRLDEAHTHYHEIVASQPTHAAALTGLAQIARRKRELDAAWAYMERAAAADPGSIAVRMQMAHTLQAMDRLDDAKTTYQGILAEYPSNPNAVAGLGYVARRQKKTAMAAGCFRRAVELGADSRDLMAAFADTLLDLGQDAEARVVYDKVGKPGESMAAWLLSRVARRLGLADDARQHLHAAVRFNPENLGLQLELAGLLRAQHRLDDAVSIYEGILAKDSAYMRELDAVFQASGDDGNVAEGHQAGGALNPNTIMLGLKLAEALVAVERLDQAEFIYRRMLAVAQHRPKSHFGLGTIARLRGDAAQAAEHFRAATALDPTVLRYQLDLAQTFCDLAKWADAQKAYLRLLDRWPGNVDALLQCAQIAAARGDERTALRFLQDAAQAAPADLRPRRQIRQLREAGGGYDWKSEIEEALTIIRAADAPASVQIEAAQTLVEYGLTETARPTLSRFEAQSVRARQLLTVAQQLERAGLVQPVQTETELLVGTEDSLDALHGCIERPTPGAETLVIVFAGTNNRVWITFSLLERILRNSSVSIVYVRDLRRSWYTRGVVGLGEDFASTVAAFEALASRYAVKRIITLGNCVGCRGALAYGLALKAQGVLGISPKLLVRDDLDATQKAKIAALRQQNPPGHERLRERYMRAEVRPKVSLIYGEDYKPDVVDIDYVADIPDVTVTGVPGAGDPDCMKDLLVRGLLTPLLHDFISGGTVSDEIRARIAASVDPTRSESEPCRR